MKGTSPPKPSLVPDVLFPEGVTSQLVWGKWQCAPKMWQCCQRSEGFSFATGPHCLYQTHGMSMFSEIQMIFSPFTLSVTGLSSYFICFCNFPLHFMGRKSHQIWNHLYTRSLCPIQCLTPQTLPDRRECLPFQWRKDLFSWFPEHSRV